jgi:hypothetical protein
MGRIVKSTGLVLMLLVSGILWGTDTDVLLSASTPMIAWIAVVVLWVEIGALIATFVLRYRAQRRSLTPVLLVAAAGLVINLAGYIVLLPAIVMGF